MEEKLIVYLDGKGKIELETQGFQGKVCDKVADQIMVSMGGRVTKDAKKPEYWDDGADPVKVLTNA